MIEPKETTCSEKGKSSLHPLETIGDNSACQRKDTIYVLAEGTRDGKYRLLKKIKINLTRTFTKQNLSFYEKSNLSTVQTFTQYYLNKNTSTLEEATD